MNKSKILQKCIEEGCENLFYNRNGRRFRCDTHQVIHARRLKDIYLSNLIIDKDKAKVYAKRWRDKNPEKSKEVYRKYRSNNIEKCRERTRLNQIKLNDRNRFGGLRNEALVRDKHTCQSCNKDVSGKRMAAIHHINHIKTDNRLENFLTLCHSCHATHHHPHRDRDGEQRYI